jgi:hypothetical protein
VASRPIDATASGFYGFVLAARSAFIVAARSETQARFMRSSRSSSSGVPLKGCDPVVVFDAFGAGEPAGGVDKAGLTLTRGILDPSVAIKSTVLSE